MEGFAPSRERIKGVVIDRTPPCVAKKLLHATAAVVIGLFTAALGTEVLARLLFPQWAPGTGAVTSFWKHDSALGWSHIPHASGAFHSFGVNSHVLINSKGFRDVERVYERDPAKQRIVVLGDSMVWGWGVEQNEIFTALIEKKNTNLEVINLGVSGYGTDQELLLLRREAVHYRSDVIVLVVMDNDFDTNVQKALFLGYQKPVFRLHPNGTLELTNTPVPEQSWWLKAASWPVRRSYILNQTARAYQLLLKILGGDARQGVASGPPPAFPGSAKEELTAALLLEIQREAKKVGAELVLVLTDRLGKRGLEIEQYFKKRHVRFLNLDPVFPKEDYNLLHLPDRVHWTPRGHQAVADSLVNYLQQEKLLRGLPDHASPEVFTDADSTGLRDRQWLAYRYGTDN